MGAAVGWGFGGSPVGAWTWSLLLAPNTISQEEGKKQTTNIKVPFRCFSFKYLFKSKKKKKKKMKKKREKKA